MPLKHFQDLTVWQEGRKLVVMIYAVTKTFPKDEQFVLSAQMRRASISVTSNVAEGFGRKTMKDKEHFYVMAYGSLTELENQILLADALTYLTVAMKTNLSVQISSVGQLLNGLLRAHRQNT